MSRKTESPAIPEGGEDAVQAIKEALEIGLGRRGDKLEKYVTFRDLKEGGFSISADGRGVKLTGLGDGDGLGGDGSPFPGQPGGPIDIGENDLTKPPRPQNVRARGMSLSSIGVTWGAPGYNNHRYAEVFASKNDNWQHIISTFDVSQPVGRGNQTPFFMGTATGSTFLHRNLSSTVPTVNVTTPIVGIHLNADNGPIVYFDSAHPFQTGDTVIFSGDDWPNSGYTGTVVQRWSTSIRVSISPDDRPSTLDPDGNEISVNTLPSGFVTVGAHLIREVEDDDLDAALNPDTIYYWVRFVSQANVVGDPQSENGIPGSVMVNPKEVLNILTGRIRMSNLANDLLVPINYVKGPLIPRLNFADYNFEVLKENVNVQIGRIDDLDFEVNDDGGRLKAVEGYFIGGNFPDASAFSAWVSNLRLNVTNTGSTLRQLDAWQASFDPAGDGALLASRVESIETKANAGQAMVNEINNLEAFYEGNQTWLGEEGIDLLARALRQRTVTSSDDQLLAWVGETLQIDVGDQSTSLNQIGQTIQVIKDDTEDILNNSITLKVQQNSGGVLTTAGFGIGLQGDPNDPGSLTSTFAVSADQFAIMGAGSQGRVVRAIGSSSTHHYVVYFTAGSGDQMSVDTDVALAFPSDAPSSVRTAFRGKTYRVKSRTSTSAHIRLLGDDGNEVRDRPAVVSVSGIQDDGYALFPAQSIPFIVNTESNPPVVGIRGKLVVDGMIHATEAEINELAATEAWSTNITNFGLLTSKSIVGQAIATPRVGGWAVRIAQPNFDAHQRVFEFSRWLTATDQTPAPDADGKWQIDPTSQFHLNNSSNESAFFLGVKANGQSHAFLRGSLTVGGGSRIYTDPAGSGTHFVQMDREFPLMVYPAAKINRPFMQTPSWDEWNYDLDPESRNYVRRNAFFWVDKSGQAGFNTPSGAIYLNDNPLELPASGGLIRVIRRINDGSRGRIFVSASFEVESNRFAAADRIGVWYELVLIGRNRSYTFNNSNWRTWSPSQKSSSVASPRTYINDHFVTVRSNRSGYDPAGAAGAFRSATGAISVTGFYCNSTTPGGRTLSGSVSVPPGEYRALVLAVDMYPQKGDGRLLYGSPGGAGNDDGGPGAAINIINGTIHSQQVSGTTGL